MVARPWPGRDLLVAACSGCSRGSSDVRDRNPVHLYRSTIQFRAAAHAVCPELYAAGRTPRLRLSPRPATPVTALIRGAWIAVTLALALPAVGLAREPDRGLSDTQIRQAIIRESIATYQASGRPCACPYNSARNGSSCGARSAYSRPGGAAPACYPEDVSAIKVAVWRRNQQ
jgi:hypothetical protein